MCHIPTGAVLGSAWDAQLWPLRSVMGVFKRLRVNRAKKWGGLSGELWGARGAGGCVGCSTICPLRDVGAVCALCSTVLPL